jgi:hypothetical protein
MCAVITTGSCPRGVQEGILIWNETYHLFDELKVIIMSDGYGICRALLLEDSK